MLDDRCSAADVVSGHRFDHVRQQVELAAQSTVDHERLRGFGLVLRGGGIDVHGVAFRMDDVAAIPVGEDRALQFAGTTAMVAGALWTHSPPSSALLAAFDSDPDQAVMRVDSALTLRDVFAVLLAGQLARPGR